MVTKMTAAEYAEFKKKSGHKEPQKVTTYYNEAKKEEEFKQHHEDRRQQNRDLRSKQEGLGGTLKRMLGGGEAKEQKVTTYYKRTGPKEKKVAPKKRAPLRDRVSASAMGFNFSPPSPSHWGFPGMSGIGMGMNSPGINGPPAWMVGGEPDRQPRRKSRRRRRDDDDEPRSRGPSYSDLGGVPDHVKRWMF